MISAGRGFLLVQGFFCLGDSVALTHSNSSCSVCGLFWGSQALRLGRPTPRNLSSHLAGGGQGGGSGGRGGGQGGAGGGRGGGQGGARGGGGGAGDGRFWERNREGGRGRVEGVGWGRGRVGRGGRGG